MTFMNARGFHDFRDQAVTQLNFPISCPDFLLPWNGSTVDSWNSLDRNLPVLVSSNGMGNVIAVSAHARSLASIEMRVGLMYPGGRRVSSHRVHHAPHKTSGEKADNTHDGSGG
jgi:hypothetical protein